MAGPWWRAWRRTGHVVCSAAARYPWMAVTRLWWALFDRLAFSWWWYTTTFDPGRLSSYRRAEAWIGRAYANVYAYMWDSVYEVFGL